MDMTWEFILRIFVAALLGGAIGLEREYRAKEAGLRTHFLVALGSASGLWRRYVCTLHSIHRFSTGWFRGL